MPNPAIPYGVRHAVAAAPTAVDLTLISFDPVDQISIIHKGGATMPALKHSTGATATNTASQDNKGGADQDQDQTED